MAPNERWHIDFKGPLGPEKENWYILVVVDAFTKYLFVEVFESKESSNVALFLRDLFIREQPPRYLHSDNGKEFVNEVIKGKWQIVLYFTDMFIAACSEFRAINGACLVQQIQGRPYHPESNGAAERVIRTINDTLTSWQNEKSKLNFAEFRGIVMWIVNNYNIIHVNQCRNSY